MTFSLERLDSLQRKKSRGSLTVVGGSVHARCASISPSLRNSQAAVANRNGRLKQLIDRHTYNRSFFPTQFSIVNFASPEWEQQWMTVLFQLKVTGPLIRRSLLQYQKIVSGSMDALILRIMVGKSLNSIRWSESQPLQVTQVLCCKPGGWARNSSVVSTLMRLFYTTKDPPS